MLILTLGTFSFQDLFSRQKGYLEEELDYRKQALDQAYLVGPEVGWMFWFFRLSTTGCSPLGADGECGVRAVLSGQDPNAASTFRFQPEQLYR